MSAKKSPAGLWDGSNEPVAEAKPEAKPEHSAFVDAPSPDPWTELIPLFTVQAWTNKEKCGHKGPIPQGSSFVCMGCHKSGKDGTPALPLKVKPPPDPKPEPRAKPKPEPQAQELRSA